MDNIDDPDRYGEMDEDERIDYFYLLRLKKTDDKFRRAYLVDER